MSKTVVLTDDDLLAHELYKASFELASDAKFILKDGKILKPNFAALKLFGVDLLDIYSGPPLQEYFASYKNGKSCPLLNEKIEFFIDQLLTANGPVWVSVKVKRAWLGNKATFVTIRDIDSLKEAARIIDVEINK